MRSYRSGDFRVLFIHRYVVTVPIALVVVALGASGLLDGLAWQRPPSPELWLYAGGAAIAFLVLKPLTDLARYLAGVYVPVPSLVEVFAAQVASWFNSASAGQPRLSGPVRPGAKYQPMSEWDTQETQQTRQEDVDRGREELNRIKAIFFDLNYPGGVVIFVGLILYYLVSASGDISQLVGNNLVTIVGGLVAVLAGFLQFVNDEALGATRKVFMLLLYLILIVTGANALLLHLPGPTPATSQTALILSDPASLLTASRTLAQALLLLLALGAVGYLFRVLDTTLRQERLAIQPQEDADLVRLGDQRIGNAYTQTGEAALNSSRNAEKAYRQAIDTNANNAAAWNGLANALSFQLSQRYQVSHHYDPAHYEQAMKAYDQALALEQNNPLYLVNKANALLGRKPAPGYDDYDLILLLSQNAIKILQASDPIRFGRGSFYARASANQQELELERRADICAGIACTKKGEQEQERGNQEVAKDRYEEAIEFYNAAAAIPHVLGMSNVPKAEAFNNKSVPYLNLAAYHNRRGDAVKAKADFEAALEAADRAIRIESNIAAFYINRGDALRGLGREDEAIAAYKRAVERAGDAEPERAALAKAKINELQAAVRTGAGG